MEYKSKFATPKRVWVNQPSANQPLHYLHGRVGIAWYDPKVGDVQLYFTEGRLNTMRVPPKAVNGLSTKNNQVDVFKYKKGQAIFQDHADTSQQQFEKKDPPLEGEIKLIPKPTHFGIDKALEEGSVGTACVFNGQGELIAVDLVRSKNARFESKEGKGRI